LTTKAVQRFQCQYQIVCSGAPKTTGYGSVGPRTRAKLNEIYGGGTSLPQATTTVPAGGAQTNVENLQNQLNALQQQLLQLMELMEQIKNKAQ